MKSSRGFTLIELLVVIAIIGILSSVVLASLNSARQKSRDARRISDIKQLQLALELYYDANSSYPTTTLGLAALAPTYISSVPTDPVGATAYTYVATAAAAGTTSCTTAPCLSYALGSSLEQTGHTALSADADHATIGTAFYGADAAGCTNGASRYCYDVTP
ncbi:MAG: prepilin-type N-terminal cleavage/methylation domain-containing protein [Candidatus Yonathbacteria bacterium]|nr:prepilin-type N-terminal cleavage/methylation domain-containing protein [Candidatus Yonathbacteria bacterium]